MLNIKKYKDVIIEEYQNLMKTTAIDGDDNRMNTAIRTTAYQHCRKILLGASNPVKWLCEEYKEPILDDGEREYLTAVIKPFRNKVKHIVKLNGFSEAKQFIRITMCDCDCANLPFFKGGTMYKGMEADKLYSLE